MLTIAPNIILNLSEILCSYTEKNIRILLWFQLEARDAKLVTLPCGHMFCQDCSKTLTGSCPVCNAKFEGTEIRRLFLWLVQHSSLMWFNKAIINEFPYEEVNSWPRYHQNKYTHCNSIIMKKHAWRSLSDVHNLSQLVVYSEDQD